MSPLRFGPFCTVLACIAAIFISPPSLPLPPSPCSASWLHILSCRILSSLWFLCIGPSFFLFYCFLQSACISPLCFVPYPVLPSSGRLHSVFCILCHLLYFALLSVRLRFSLLRQITTSWLSSFWLLAPFCPLSPSLCHGYRSIVLSVLCLPVEVRWTCSSPLQQTPTRCSPRHISVFVWLVWFALTWSWHLLSASCGPSHSQLLVVLSLFLHYFSISFCIWCNRSDFWWFGLAISMYTASVHVTCRKCSWSESHFDCRILRVGLPVHFVPPVRIFR